VPATYFADGPTYDYPLGYNPRDQASLQSPRHSSALPYPNPDPWTPEPTVRTRRGKQTVSRAAHPYEPEGLRGGAGHEGRAEVQRRPELHLRRRLAHDGAVVAAAVAHVARLLLDLFDPPDASIIRQLV